MLDPVLAAADIYIFYMVSTFIIHWAFLLVTSLKYWNTWLFALLIIFVGSEFWEIPIFIMAYAGAPGFWAPNIYNHLIVALMTVLLLAFSRFQLDLKNGSVLIAILAFNFIFLLGFPGALSSWLLRSITLTGLTYIFLREILRHE